MTRQRVGDLYLADISVPVQVYQGLGIEPWAYLRDVRDRARSSRWQQQRIFTLSEDLDSRLPRT
jgi:hypothetical protein